MAEEDIIAWKVGGDDVDIKSTDSDKIMKDLTIFQWLK